MKQLNNQKGAAHILLIALLIVGLIVGVYLIVNQETNLKSKASGSIINAFDIRDANGKEVKCTENTTTGIPECEIETLEFTMGLKDSSVIQNP